MSRRALAVTLALLLATAPAAGAQELVEEPGFWIGIGAGGGSAAVACDGCQTSRETALAGHVRFGGTVWRRLQVGVELGVWRRNQDTLEEEISVLSADLRWSPRLLGGLALRGGVGRTEYLALFEGAGGFTAETRTQGWTLVTGAAWPLRVHRSVSVDPFVHYSHQLEGEMRLGGVGTGERALVSLLQFGLGLTWHQGARD